VSGASGDDGAGGWVWEYSVGAGLGGGLRAGVRLAGDCRVALLLAMTGVAGLGGRGGLFFGYLDAGVEFCHWDFDFDFRHA
jgi:hypothetical protein